MRAIDLTIPPFPIRAEAPPPSQSIARSTWGRRPLPPGFLAGATAARRAARRLPRECASSVGSRRQSREKEFPPAEISRKITTFAGWLENHENHSSFSLFAVKE